MLTTYQYSPTCAFLQPGAATFCLGASLLAAAPAVCAQTYQYIGQFGEGTLGYPTELAVDPATRNIYVSVFYGGFEVPPGS